MAKYGVNSMRPIHKCTCKTLFCNFVLVIQETDVKYLVIPIYKRTAANLNDEYLEAKEKVWRSKSTFTLEDRIGEILVSGWGDNIEGGENALFNIIDKSSGEEKKEPKAIRLPKVIKVNNIKICKYCGCDGNTLRDDGIIQCKQCGVYYMPIIS